MKYDDDSDDSLNDTEKDDGQEEVPLPEGGVKWVDFYKEQIAEDTTIRGHFISTFFRYPSHIKGGCHSDEESLIQTHQVNVILDAIDPKGDDLTCLVRNDGLDVWKKFLGPKHPFNELTGNTLKVYIRILELSITFIQKNLFYDKTLLVDNDKQAIISVLGPPT